MPAVRGYIGGRIRAAGGYITAEGRLHGGDHVQSGESWQVRWIDQIGMFDPQPTVAATMSLFQPLINVQDHMHGIGAQRMGHDLKPSLVQVCDQALVVLRRVHQRRNESSAAIGEEFHEIGCHPVIVIQPPSRFQISEKFRCQMMLNRNRAECGSCAHGKLPSIAQGKPSPPARGC